MSIDFRGLQERLRERLLAHIHAGELTGLELARATGFQQAHISNFLNRKRGLSLEAMDAILRASQIRLVELLEERERSAYGEVIFASTDEEFMSVPLVEEQNCLATEVPNDEVREWLKIGVRTLERLERKMRVPRPHWQRFVAIEVKDSDVAAMAPRLVCGTVAVIDRHHNAPTPGRPGAPDMFLVKAERNFHIRYVQVLGNALVVRGHSPEIPANVIEGAERFAAILGRVCVLQVQL